MNNKPFVSQLILEGSPFNGWWYVQRWRFSPSQRWNYADYLHENLTWKSITHDGNGKYCYFRTKTEAEALRKRWEETNP